MTITKTMVTMTMAIVSMTIGPCGTSLITRYSSRWHHVCMTTTVFIIIYDNICFGVGHMNLHMYKNTNNDWYYVPSKAKVIFGYFFCWNKKQHTIDTQDIEMSLKIRSVTKVLKGSRSQDQPSYFTPPPPPSLKAKILYKSLYIHVSLSLYISPSYLVIRNSTGYQVFISLWW